MKTPLFVVVSVAFASIVFAQQDRRAIQYYEANFEKYLGKEISVNAASSTRQDMGEHGDVAVFQIYTRGRVETGFTYAVVPKSEVDKFSKKYAEDEDFNKTTPLRGVFTKGPYFFYISVDGAVLPDEKADASSDSE